MIWALEIELGGIKYFFATEIVDIDGQIYQSGLGDFTSSKIVSLEESITISIETDDDWAQYFEGRSLLVDGGTASIFYVVNEKASKWMTGTVRNVSWGPFGDKLSCDIIAIGREYMFPFATAQVDQETQPDNHANLTLTGSYILWSGNPQWMGSYYPIVIGYPGFRDNVFNDDQNNAYMRCVVPGPVTETVLGTTPATFDPSNPGVPENIPDYPVTYNIAVAYGEIASATSSAFVWTQDTTLPAHEVNDLQEVVKVQDNLGNIYWSVEHGNSIEDPEVYIGFGPPDNDGYAGGLLWEGSVMRGAIDIFEWLITTYTDLDYDREKQAAHKTYLNHYLFDTYVVEPHDAIQWYMSEIMEYLPAVMARGEDGFYLAYMPRHATKKQSILEIIGYSPGVTNSNATLVSGPNQSSNTITNELTVQYQWDEQNFADTFKFTAVSNQLVALPGGGVYPDQRAQADLFCAESQAHYGPMPGTISLETVWDTNTAQLIARDHILMNAFASEIMVYTMDEDYHYLGPGDVVTVTDASIYKTDVLCIVDDIEPNSSSTTIRVTVRILPDP